jgi:S-phase kinase-associated protein 1
MSFEEVRLQSMDGSVFTVPIKVAELSETVKQLIEDAGTTQAIPLPNVSTAILTKVIDYCKYHTEHPAPAEPAKEEKDKRSDDIIEWDLDFTKNLDQPALFELILAANYMDVKPLLDLTCKTVANMIKGKTPDEIRKTFNITSDFTPEEEEAVRKENEWCEER